MLVIWIGVLICLMHSALFSGLNLGFFGLSRLRLEVQAKAGNDDADRILQLRKDAHLLLATLLWGNVASNVLLTLLTKSLLAGVGAFLFSTIGITFFGEIFPQSYLAKNALKTSSVLVPVVRFYQFLLFPITKPTAILLDNWLGKEKITYFQEKEFKILLEEHGQSQSSDVAKMESVGAINFLALDDIKVNEEGEIINPKSIIKLPTQNGLPLFPSFERESNDPFLQMIHASEEKWVIITDPQDKPLLVLNADQFLRDAMYGEDVSRPYIYCHRPIIVTALETKLGEVILELTVHPESSEDDVVDHDIMLYWGKEKRIITGSDILGRLLRGIVKRDHIRPEPS